MNQITDKQKKDFEDKVIALKLIEKQYPAMAELHQILKENPQEFRRMYPVILIQEVSKQLGIPMSGVDILGGKPYINKTGLLAKVQKDPRRILKIKATPVLYAIEIQLLNQPTDEDFKKYFIGCSKDGTAIYHAIVQFEDGSVYEDEGTANAKYLNRQWGKMSTMIPYVNELAATRAVNRTLRLATGIGLVSVEELNERGYSMIKEKAQQNITGDQVNLIEKIEKLYKSLKYNEARKLMTNSKFGGGPDMTTMSKSDLEKILYFLEETKKGKSNDKKKLTHKRSKK